MDVHIAETLQLLIGIAGGVAALGAILRYKLSRRELESGASTDTVQTVEALRHELNELRAEHAEQLNEVYERLDFAERMLTRGRAEDGSVEGGGR